MPELKANCGQLWDDLRGKNGITYIPLALLAIGIITAMVVFMAMAAFAGDLDFIGICAALTLVYYILISFGHRRKSDKLKKKEDKS